MLLLSKALIFQGIFHFPNLFDYCYLVITLILLIKCYFNIHEFNKLSLLSRQILLLSKYYIILRILSIIVFLCITVMFYRYQLGIMVLLDVIIFLGISQIHFSKQTIYKFVFTIVVIVMSLSGMITKNHFHFGGPTGLYGIMCFLSGLWIYTVVRSYDKSPEMESMFWPLVFTTLFYFIVVVVGYSPNALEAFQSYQQTVPRINWIFKSNDIKSNDHNQEFFYHLNTTSDGKLVVASHGEGLRLYDSSGKGQLATLRAGDPYVQWIQGFDIDKEKKLIYASIYKTLDRTSPVIVICNENLEVVEYVYGQRCIQPIGLALNKKNNAIFYSCELSSALMKYDLGSSQSVIFQEVHVPYDAHLSEDEKYVYVDSSIYPTFLRLEANTGKLAGKAIIGCASAGIETDLSRNRIYVSSFIFGQVFEIDDQTIKVVSRIDTDFGARDITLDTKRGLLYVGNYFFGTLSVINLQTHEEKKLFAGPRLRAVYYDLEKDRIYFCSRLGIGYFTGNDFSSSVPREPFLKAFVHFFCSLFDAMTRQQFMQFIQIFNSSYGNSIT